MEEKTCKTCKHFLQHYVRVRSKYMETACGHCIHPRLKSREPEMPACARYCVRRTAASKERP